MSEENVEVVRRVFEAAGRRDSAAVLALYDLDVEWDMARGALGGVVDRDVYHGHEGLRRYFRLRSEAWETITDECEELIDAGEHVISTATVRGRGRASGAEVEENQSGIWTIREGKVVRVVWFPTREAALKAAGLSE
ncbi:MAG: nuclear transport factor 2 family protein [Actinomycetota bacterium]|nr:nuclear transport factor 2 family protein [Actinomycetota bacterium]